MRQDVYKATVEVGDKKVTFEGPREFVEEQVSKLTRYSSKPNAALPESSGEANATEARLNERDLIQAKRPKGHLETVAVLAFALASSGSAEFTEDDMRRAYLRAGVRPPKVVGQALRDAKNRMDYIEPGGKKGTYRLSHHGDRTVRFDFPRHPQG
jgi:hypothetical protein